MEQREIKSNTEYILSKYTTEVRELYGIDAMFTRCVDAMARGTSPHEIIGTFALCHITMNKQMEEIIMLLPPRPITIIP